MACVPNCWVLLDGFYLWSALSIAVFQLKNLNCRGRSAFHTSKRHLCYSKDI